MRRAPAGRGRAGALIAAVVTATGFAAAVLATGCTSVAGTAESARKKDRECVDAIDAAVTQKHARSWFVVQDGEVAAISPSADDAVRGAEAPRAGTAGAPAVRGALHRFVFRPADRGDRLYRMAFLAGGGMVAGRLLLADLGFTIASTSAAGAGRSVVLERRGSRRTLDLAQRPLLRIDLTPLGGGDVTTVEVPLDPDFDGPLLLAPEAAQSLGLDRAEIPGGAEVQVALGRPFNARRGFAAARCPELDAAAPVEVLVPSGPPEKRK